MKKPGLAFSPCLAACGAKGNELTLTVGGATMAELEAIRTELSRLQGVSEIKAGKFMDGQATFTYDNGKIWNRDYRFDGGAVWLGKNLWMKRP